MTEDDHSRRSLAKQLQLIQPAVVGLALLMAFAEQRGDSFVAVFMYALVHLAATALLVAWLDEANRIEVRDGPRGGASVGQLRRQIFWISATLEAACAIALVLGWHELDLAEGKAQPDLSHWGWKAGLVVFWAVFAGTRVRKYLSVRRRFTG